MDEQFFQHDGWRAWVCLWIERAGSTVLGKGRLELLERIDRCRSISAAARDMGISYRHAWELVQGMNEGAGEPLVTAVVGGKRGGGAVLTPVARRVIAVFRELQDRLGQTASSILPRLTERADATLHVAAAVSLEEVLGQLLNDFGAQCPDIRVRVVFGASDELAGHLLAGAPVDLFLTADARHLDRLDLAERADFAGNGLAVIGSAGLAKAIHKPADIVRATAARVALAVPDCPLGGYTRAYLESLRLYEALLPRAIRVENSRAVTAAVRDGHADVGFVYLSDAKAAADCRTLFRARRLPLPIRYTAALLRRAADSAGAHALLTFLTSADAARHFRACGFVPVRKSAAKELPETHG